MQREMREKGIERKGIGMGTAALFGAAAGYAMWLTCVFLFPCPSSPSLTQLPCSLHSRRNYPLDVIKSRMVRSFRVVFRPEPHQPSLTSGPSLPSTQQTDGLPSQPSLRRYASPLDCARQLYAENGARGFLRGLTPTLIRWAFLFLSPFPVNHFLSPGRKLGGRTTLTRAPFYAPQVAVRERVNVRRVRADDAALDLRRELIIVSCLRAWGRWAT